jgi:hypothetical protein
MKRLLAYLFIVLGLGLTFNVSAEAKSLIVMCDLSLDQNSNNSNKIKLKLYYSFSEFKKSKSFKDKACKRYVEPNQKLYRFLNNDFTNKGKFVVWKKEIDYLIERFGPFQLYLFNDGKSKLTNTQIAKAEPSQTQKIAKVNKSKYNFCKQNNTNVATISLNCDSYQKKINLDEFVNIYLNLEFNNITDNDGKQIRFNSKLERLLFTYNLYDLNTDLLLKSIKSNEVVNSLYTKSPVKIAKAETSQTQKVEEKVKVAKAEEPKQKESSIKVEMIADVYEDNKFIKTTNFGFRTSINLKDKEAYKWIYLYVFNNTTAACKYIQQICIVTTIKFTDLNNSKNNKIVLNKEGFKQSASLFDILNANHTQITELPKPKQEEFKPKSTNQDKDPPVIQIASNITVSDTTYEIEGVVKDNSENIFVEIDGQTIQAKNGKFKLQRYSPIDHQLKIVAVDQWGNRSEPKLVDIKIESQVAKSASIIEPLNPSNLKVKADRNKVALVIGVEKYENTPSAKFASLDAKYFKDYARKAFGVLDDNINLLTDEEANLSKTTSAFFKWLPSKIKSNKTDLIIFYAGHGLASSDGKDKYILPFDADPDLLSRTAISRKEIFDLIISLKPRSVTIFLDTCYSGVSRDEQMLLASARPLRVIADDDEKLPDNFTIFSASENDQISSGLESAKHGIFSYYLMKGLEGKADLDQDGKLTNNELLTYLDNNVSEKALNLGRQQNPTLTGNPDQILARY